MIDEKKYEGHTTNWKWLDLSEGQDNFYLFSEHGDIINNDTPDGKLAQDAPLLLAEVERLREALQEILNDFETKKTDMWTMRNRIETILKGDD